MNLFYILNIYFSASSTSDLTVRVNPGNNQVVSVMPDPVDIKTKLLSVGCTFIINSNITISFLGLENYGEKSRQ